MTGIYNIPIPKGVILSVDDPIMKKQLIEDFAPDGKKSKEYQPTATLIAANFVNMNFKDTQAPEMLLKKRADIKCTILHIHMHILYTSH